VNQDFHSHCTLNQISSMMKRVSGPGSRRRYNDKICGHQEKASENDQEFQSIMMELQRDVKSVQDPGPGQPTTLTYTSLPWTGSMPDLTLLNDSAVINKRTDSGGGVIKVERDKREISPYSRSPSPRSNSPRQVFLNHREEFRPPGGSKARPKSNSLQIPSTNRQRSNSDSKIPSYSTYTTSQSGTPDNLYTSPQDIPAPSGVNQRLGGLGVPIRTSVIRSPSPRRKTVSDFYPQKVVQDPSVPLEHRKHSHPSHMTFPEIVITHHEGEDTLANLASCQANNSFLSGGYRNSVQSQYSYSNPGTPESPVYSPSSPGDNSNNSNDQDYETEYLINNLMEPGDKEKLMEMLSQNTADLNIENTENYENMNINFNNFDLPTLGAEMMSEYPGNVSSIQDPVSNLNRNTFEATCDHVDIQNVNSPGPS